MVLVVMGGIWVACGWYMGGMLWYVVVLCGMSWYVVVVRCIWLCMVVYGGAGGTGGTGWYWVVCGGMGWYVVVVGCMWL